MAGLGFTKLQAVNLMLLAVGQSRSSSLTATSGTDDCAEAHYFLDMATEEVIAEGHPGATKVSSYTASAGGEIDLASAEPLAVRVRGSGKYEKRELTIQGTKVYDTMLGTTACFGNAEVVTLEVFKLASASSPANFEDLPPDLKHKITHRAAQNYRAYKRFDPNFDAMMARQTQRTESTADRDWMRPRGGSPMQPIQLPPIGSNPPAQVATPYR